MTNRWLTARGIEPFHQPPPCLRSLNGKPSLKAEKRERLDLTARNLIHPDNHLPQETSHQLLLPALPWPQEALFPP